MASPEKTDDQITLKQLLQDPFGLLPKHADDEKIQKGKL